jgi:outer membrane protein OmpU
MKKVLLATTALTLSAGFASADVSMSGTGGAGVFGAAGADLSVYSGVDLGFRSKRRIRHRNDFLCFVRHGRRSDS